MTNPLTLVPWEQGNAFLNASVLELAYKMVLKTIARKGLRDRGPSLAPIVLSITLNYFMLWFLTQKRLS